jgi:hypothetical protein
VEVAGEALYISDEVGDGRRAKALDGEGEAKASDKT